VSDGDTICAPALLDGVKPLLDFTLKGVKAEVEVLSLAPLRGGPIQLAAGVDQPTGRLGLLVPGGVPVGLQGIEEVATCVALTNELATEGVAG
jgi:hypothetical protein